jgi:sterol-4alpha-carboxylate 3-dehydrogenase (decarboxylating)
MAHAFKLALDRLSLDSPLAGQSYFITDYAPSNFFEFFKPYFEALHVKYGESHLPAGVAMLMAQAAEALYRVKGGTPPLISRYAVAATSRDFWFNHHKAARDLNYAPVVSEADAFQRTLAWVRETLLN